MSESADVLCAGIIVADHVCTPISHLPAAGELVMAERLLLTIGGCAANAAVDLVKMGVPATILGRVGGDVFGRVVADMLRQHGVDVSAIKVSPEADTSQTLIVNVAGEDRRFIHTFGANAEFRAADIPLERVARCRVLYLGGYFLMPNVRQEELVPVFAAARQAGARTVLDVVTPGPGDYLDGLEQLLPHVDVFLPNHDEAQQITGEADPVRQAEIFHQLGAATVVITLGGAARSWSTGRRAAGRRLPGDLSWTAAAAVMLLMPATSSGYCKTCPPRIVCAWPAPWAPAACGPSAPPPASSPAPSAKPFSASTRCRSSASEPVSPQGHGGYPSFPHAQGPRRAAPWPARRCIFRLTTAPPSCLMPVSPVK